jgi:hypothetical protein
MPQSGCAAATSAARSTPTVNSSAPAGSTPDSTSASLASVPRCTSTPSVAHLDPVFSPPPSSPLCRAAMGASTSTAASSHDPALPPPPRAPYRPHAATRPQRRALRHLIQAVAGGAFLQSAIASSTSPSAILTSPTPKTHHRTTVEPSRLPLPAIDVG